MDQTRGGCDRGDFRADRLMVSFLPSFLPSFRFRGCRCADGARLLGRQVVGRPLSVCVDVTSEWVPRLHLPMVVWRLPISIQDVALSLYVKEETVANFMHGRNSKSSCLGRHSNPA